MLVHAARELGQLMLMMLVLWTLLMRMMPVHATRAWAADAHNASALRYLACKAWAADAHNARPLGFVGSWVRACAVDTHAARPLGASMIRSI